jgi:hypothetical protein
MARYTLSPRIEIDSKRCYANIKYPQIPLQESDYYVYSTAGDRFDTLAKRFYGTDSLWWIISLANESLPQDSLLIPPGTQLRIPTDTNRIIDNYAAINSL